MGEIRFLAKLSYGSASTAVSATSVAHRNREPSWVAHCRAKVSNAISSMRVCSRLISGGAEKSKLVTSPRRLRRVEASFEG